MTTALLILPNFVLILVGLALARGFDYGRGFWEGLEKLVYFVLFPALLLRSLAVSVLDLASVGKVVACAWAIMLLGMALAWLARPLFRVEAKVAASCFQCGFRFNTYIGLAVAGSVFGAPGVATA
ncbi:MAG: AEC family transporter, partial [Betaproteobacteria bacterium]|nr:AEC family transporter [Betaproteobacteria bacterium]